MQAQPSSGGDAQQARSSQAAASLPSQEDHKGKLTNPLLPETGTQKQNAP